MVEFLCNYGPFKAKAQHKIIYTGYDYYRIRHKGTAYCVPMIVVSKLP